jgi:hypothetical protein
VSHDEEDFEDALRRLLKEEVAIRLEYPRLSQSAEAARFSAGRSRLKVLSTLVAACLLIAVTVAAIGLAGQGGRPSHVAGTTTGPGHPSTTTSSPSLITGTLRGHLIVGVSGGPPPGILTLSPGNGPVAIWQGSHLVTVVTAKNGAFVAQLRPGSYRLRATINRWCSWQNVSIRANSSVSVTLDCVEQIR